MVMQAFERQFLAFVKGIASGSARPGEIWVGRLCLTESLSTNEGHNIGDRNVVIQQGGCG